MNRFKKIICSIALILAFLSTNRVYASSVIKDVKERQNIASGVEYVKIDRFSDAGFIDINVLKLENNNNFSKLIPMISTNGVSNKETLSNMMNNVENTVGAINGDYFETTNYTMALGSLVGEEKIILTTPEAAFSRNSFFITKDGKAGVGSLNNNITVNIKGDTLSVNALNKVSKPYRALSILDENWGKTSPGRSIGGRNVELQVANGVVIDKKVGGEPMLIIPGSYILTQNGDALLKYNIGDKVNIDFGDYKNLKFSVGGANVLTRGGKVADNKKFNKARAPRTAIGVDSNNKTIFLVTVDGRNNSSIGMTELELAQFMQSIGAANSINLDGGGSTTMGVKKQGTEKPVVVNAPSDGSERPIVNGISITSKSPIGEPSYIRLVSEEDMWSGNSYDISAEIYDKNHNKLNINSDEINISSENGTINSGKFSPQGSGNGKIYASYKNLSTEKNIYIHSDIKEIKLDVEKLELDNDKKHFFETIYGLDEKGFRKKLNPADLTFEASPEIGTLDHHKFTAISEGAADGFITASYKDIKKVIPVAVGTKIDDIDIFKDDLKVTTIPNNDTLITSDYNILDDNGEKYINLVYSINPYKKKQISELNFNGLSLGSSKYIGLEVLGKSEGETIVANFRDENGNKASTNLVTKVDFSDWKYIEAAIPSNLKGNIYLDKLSVVINDEKQQVSNIGFKNLKSASLVSANRDFEDISNKVIDSKNYVVDGTQGFNFTIANLDTSGKGDNQNRIAALDNNHVAVALSGVSEKTRNNIKSEVKFNGNDKFNIKNYGATSFITLEINNKGIRSANSAQFKPFLDSLENKDIKNYIIFMNSSPEYISGEKEKTFFNNEIKKAIKSGKEVFIVTPGYYNDVKLYEGYRIISLNNQSNTVLKFNENNGNISYYLKNL